MAPKVLVAQSSRCSVARCSLHSLPRELLFTIALFSLLQDIFTLTVTCTTLRDALIGPYLLGLKRFVLEEQNGNLSVLRALLAYGSKLEAIVLDERIEYFNYITKNGPLYSECFSHLRPAYLLTLILKGCSGVSNDDLLIVAKRFHNLTALGGYQYMEFNCFAMCNQCYRSFMHTAAQGYYFESFARFKPQFGLFMSRKVSACSNTENYWTSSIFLSQHPNPFVVILYTS